MRDIKKTQRCFNFSMEPRADSDNKGVIEGRAIVYDSPTDLGFFTEVIEKDALKNTNMKDVRLLVNHDTSMIPLARSRNNNENSTLQLIPDDKGLRMKAKLDIENNSDAKNLYSAIERGDITGMSFMFSVRDEKWEDIDSEHPTRRITQIGTVVEVSAVTFPAYKDADIYARSSEALESAAATLEKARQLRAKSPEGDLELEKAKLEFISKL